MMKNLNFEMSCDLAKAYFGFTFMVPMLVICSVFVSAQSPSENNVKAVDDHIIRSVKNKGRWAPSSCRDDIKAGDGYIIRSIDIKGRWVPSLEKLGLDGLIGQVYSPQKVSDIQSKISSFLTEGENRSLEISLLDSTGGMLITSCVLAHETQKVVDISVSYFGLRLNVYNIEQNVLPVPRSSSATFYRNTPKALLIFNPKIKANYDRGYGFATSIDVQTDLLQLNNLLTDKKVSAGKNRLNLSAAATKSLDNSFYETNASLSFSRRRIGRTVENFRMGLNYKNNLIPRGDGENFENAIKLEGGMKFRFGKGTVDTLYVDAGFRRSRNKYSRRDGTQHEKAFENGVGARILINGTIAGGPVRMAAWFDSNALADVDSSYRRATAAIGYEKEFGKKNSTFSLEVLFGAGKAWGATPEYARFFGGSSGKNFLYESPESAVLLTPPTGPLIRSFGSGRLTTSNGGPSNIRGGTFYQNLNLNFAVPIPGLSKPLIPDLLIELPSGNTIPLKQQLKNVTDNTALNTLAANFEADGLSPEEAEEKAARIVNNDIKPISNFIANKANIFAFKPLIMFDAARLGSSENQNEKTRLALGGGIQVIVVAARFEAGYMRTIRRLPGDDKGNLVFRLFFQNLF